MSKGTKAALWLAFIFMCCLPVTCISSLLAYRNYPTLQAYWYAYAPMLPTPAEYSGQPDLSPVVDAINTTIPAINTPEGMPTQPPTATPTSFPVDEMQEIKPRVDDFQAAIRKANVIKGKNVLPLASGDPLYGYAKFTDTRSFSESTVFPFSLFIGGKKVTVYSENFESTVAVFLDQAIYLPAVMSQVQVLPDYTHKVQVPIINEDGVAEIVEMYDGIVVFPDIYTCYSGFGLDPWQISMSSGGESQSYVVNRFDTFKDAAYWYVQAVSTGDDHIDWALSRYRFVVLKAAYSALDAGLQDPDHRSLYKDSPLEDIHNASVALLTKSSGAANVPSAYDLLLAYFDEQAGDYDFHAIKEIKFGTINRGNMICATNSPLIDQRIIDILNGPVPDNFLVNP